jgi:hypothetical protein
MKIQENFETLKLLNFGTEFFFVNLNIQVLQSIGNLSQKNTRQLYYVNLFLRWRGTSLRGLDYLARLNMALSKKTMLNIRTEHIKEIQLSVSEIYRNFATVIWVDNYNKYFRHVSLNKGGYSSFAWTALAFKKFAMPISKLASSIGMTTNLDQKPFVVALFSQVVATETLRTDFDAAVDEGDHHILDKFYPLGIFRVSILRTVTQSCIFRTWKNYAVFETFENWGNSRLSNLFLWL